MIWLVLLGCKSSQTPVASDAEPTFEWWAAGDKACAEGAVLKGASPPKGTRVWCEAPDGEKDGPFSTWTEENLPRQEGAYQKGMVHGRWTTWHRNGEKYQEATYEHSKLEGPWREWWDDGTRSLEASYQHDNRHGLWVEWHRNGEAAVEGMYLDGLKDGTWIYWDDRGNIQRVEEFRLGSMVRSR